MQTGRILTVVTVVAALILLLAASSTVAGSRGRLTADNPNPPTETVKLIFIHHSCGENWLDDRNGGLGLALRDSSYFVSDTNYGWGPDSIGDNTDIGHWWTWFRGPRSGSYLAALYAQSDQNSSYSRLPTDPGGENEIVMFKSCYPNSDLRGDAAENPPPIGSSPLRGQSCGSLHHTVANAKSIYNDLLEYFATRQDKLFVVITAPPVQNATYASNARAFNTWLVEDWLDAYPHNNVAVFDFYNVLTSNGGNWYTNDLGWAMGNHHRHHNGAIEYITDQGGNTAAYPNDGSDNHPSPAGNQKASGEFVPLLNIFYHRWKGTGETPTPTATGAPPTATSTHTPTRPHSPTPTPSATLRASATPTRTPSTGQQTMIFQDGVSPDPSYAGTTDVILANDEDNVAPNANLGGLENLETFFGEGEEHRRSLMRWDLSALPGDAIIVSATVELYRYDGSAENAMQIALYRLTRDWAEGTGWDFWPDPSYVPDGATWTLASPGTAWTTPGGDFDTTIVGQITLPAGMGNGWVSLDATAAVRAWVEDGLPNYGLLLRPLNGDYTYHYYYSRNHSILNLHPRLVVTYAVWSTTTPTPTASATPVSPDLPDLIVNSMKIELETGDACDYTSTQLGVRVWVENIGGGDTCPFVVDVNGSQQDISSGLVAGQITSTWLADAYIWPGDNTAFADATFLVEESNEDNNQLTQFLPIPTLPPTCTPTGTPTPPTCHFIYLPLIMKEWSAPSPTPTTTPTTVTPSRLIQPTELMYEGAFRLLDGPPDFGWEWSGAAMSYYPGGDPDGPADGCPGSIFGTGHNWNQYVSEISIPVPVISSGKNVNDLNTATTLQDFHDVRGDLFGEFEMLRAGLEYLPAQGAQTTDKLYFCWGQHFQFEPATSHGWSELDLSDPQPAGAWRIDDQPNYVTNDYLFAIPQAWADANTPGMYLATGRYRDGGQGARGPSLFAYGPWNDGNPPALGSLLSTVPLLLYTDVTSADDYTLNDYLHCDEWSGGAWLTAGNKSAVIFVGTKGTGDCWYGCADGRVWEPPYPPDCPDRGWWCTGFEGQILFYNPADLAAVAQGEMETWEPQPYATLGIDEHLYNITSDQQKAHVGAASFDRERGLLYVFEPLADGDKSLVHVWRVEGTIRHYVDLEDMRRGQMQ